MVGSKSWLIQRKCSGVMIGSIRREKRLETGSGNLGENGNKQHYEKGRGAARWKVYWRGRERERQSDVSPHNPLNASPPFFMYK